MNKRALVVEDDPDIVELVEHYLAADGWTVESSGRGREALQKARSGSYQLLVLDLQLPDLDGLSICAEVRRDPRTVHLPIVMLTARGDEIDRVVGLEGGADDYIVKPFSQRELLARIRAALRRSVVAEGEVVTVGQLKLDAASHQVSVEGAEIALGPTEYRLLEFFMHHPDRVYSRAQLLDRVWGGNVYVEERTVDVHIRRLRKALTPYGYDRLIRTVRGAGYRFSPGQT